MAPEFLGFFVAIGLGAACLALATIALLSGRSRRRLWALVGLIPTAALTLLAFVHLRQEFILNEPMATAAHQGRIETVRTLLDRGASPNSWGVDGAQTALMGACAAGHIQVVQLLIERGADVYLSDGPRRTALAYARELGHKDIEQVLIQAGAR